LVKKKVKKGAAVMQPLFLLFLYGVYKWSTALAADIAVKALWYFKAFCRAVVWWRRRELYLDDKLLISNDIFI
jgi:hypothetical protein